MQALLIAFGIIILVLAAFSLRVVHMIRVEREIRISCETKLSHLQNCEADLAEQRQEVIRLVGLSSELEGKCARLPDLEREIAELRTCLVETTTEAASLRTANEEKDKANREQIEALRAIRGEIDNNLKLITANSLEDNRTLFLRLATTAFQEHKEPIEKMLNEYEKKFTESERQRNEAYGALTTEVKSMAETQESARTETAKLVNALRAEPKTRGRWGEHTLRKIIELAGLSSHCDFTIEKTLSGGALRPDLIIHLPGGRSLVVDAKTPVSAYLDALNATDDHERERLLGQHVVHIRNHVKQLAAKRYWDSLPTSLDFVVMFIPGDDFYVAAAERDPALFEDALALGVHISFPATMIALAKSVAYSWRQEKVAENSRAVHNLGRELYKRLSTMGGHIVGLGKSLSGSVKHYNDFVGSLESSVMPQARKFNELEVEGTILAIDELPLIEQGVRPLAPNRDILLPRSTTETKPLQE